jgi:integrase
MRAPLTKKLVESVPPGPRDAFLWDVDPVGFGLKVTPSGGRIFVYQYRAERAGKQGTSARRYTIGPFGKLTPDQARKRAKELAATVALGGDPMEQERASKVERDATVEAALEKIRLESELALNVIAARWLDDYEQVKERRPASIRQASLVVRNHLLPRLGAVPMPHIGQRDVQAIVDAIPLEQRGMRRAVYAYGRILWTWAIARQYVDHNPFIAIEKPQAPKARERVLADGELKVLWEATQTAHPLFGALFRLLVITGQRRSEVAEARWEEFDRAESCWTIPVKRSKNGKAHIVPLAPLAVAELDRLAGSDDWPSNGFILSTTGRTPISGISKAKRALDVAMGVDDWRLHDIRRSVATGLQKIATRFEVTEAVLNHVSGAKSGIAGVYQKHDWAPEKRTALEAWARRLDEIINDAKSVSNVIAMAR